MVTAFGGTANGGGVRDGAEGESARGHAILECRGLVAGHRGAPLLPPTDLTLSPGELLAVVGGSGAGKTTWLKTLLGLLRPVQGCVRLAWPGVRLTYVHQRQACDDLYPLRVRDAVAMALGHKLGLTARPRETQRRVHQALTLVGAEALERRPFRELSDAQKQRVLLARVAAAAPDVAVLDEPTSMLDAVQERELWAKLERLRERTRVALIVVSEYLGLVATHADRVLLVDRERPAALLGTPAHVFAHDAFRARYGGFSDPLRAAV